MKTWGAVPVLSDPSADRTPLVDPVSVLPSSSSSEKAAPRAVVQLNAAHLQPEETAVAPGPDGPSSREAPTGSSRERIKEDPVDLVAPGAAGMKSRLQKLAEQRKCWDGE